MSGVEAYLPPLSLQKTQSYDGCSVDPWVPAVEIDVAQQQQQRCCQQHDGCHL